MSNSVADASKAARAASLVLSQASLKQRNAALRRGEPATAWVFDRPFAVAAATVVACRTPWVATNAPRFAELSAALGEQVPAEVAYRPNSAEVADTLAAAHDRDVRRGTTTVGPHRDDLVLALGGKDTRHFGSAGQQRTAAIALRLLEAESLDSQEAHLGRRDLRSFALFDDVFAELDATRQERLLELIAETMPGQAIVTAPREAEVPQPLLDRPRWSMTGGRIGH